jgi:hypothetical protein
MSRHCRSKQSINEWLIMGWFKLVNQTTATPMMSLTSSASSSESGSEMLAILVYWFIVGYIFAQKSPADVLTGKSFSSTYFPGDLYRFTCKLPKLLSHNYLLKETTNKPRLTRCWPPILYNTQHLLTNKIKTITWSSFSYKFVLLTFGSRYVFYGLKLIFTKFYLRYNEGI